VPWLLLREAPIAGSTSAGVSSSSQLPSFVFTGDTAKLQSAPAFDPNTDLTQPTWRQSVLSYFGLSSGGAATGASESPGGSSSKGSSSSSSSSDKDSSSPSTSPK
jgi:hypothetical protein